MPFKFNYLIHNLNLISCKIWIISAKAKKPKDKPQLIKNIIKRDTKLIFSVSMVITLQITTPMVIIA